MVHLKPPKSERPMARGPWSLSRAWRLIATALSFAIFGLGGLVLALFVFPVLRLLYRDNAQREDVFQATVHNAFHLYINVMRLLGVLTYETHNLDVLRNCRGTVVVANHPSLIDVVFLMAFMRHTRAVIKNAVATNPFMKGVVLPANYIPNRGEPEELMKACTQALKDNKNLCIFPEGSRTPIGEKIKYQRGFAYVAMAANAPVLTVTIEVDPPTLRKWEPWYSIPLKRPHWKICVHDVIDTPSIYGYERSVSSVRKLALDVQGKIEKELRI